MADDPETTGGQQDGRFRKGRSGNPAGRPSGARHKTTLAVEALLEGEAEHLTRKAIELAQVGDMQALRLCMDRISPPRKDRHVAFRLPPLETVDDAKAANAALVEAVANGDLTPGEATDMAKLVECFVKTIETTELAARLAKLERSLPA